MKLVTTFIMLLVSCCLCAQPVTYSYSTTHILIGEPITLTVKTITATGTEPPFFSPDTLPHFEVLEVSKTDTALLNGNYQLTKTITLTSWDSGRWAVPTTFLNNTSANPVFIDVGYTSPFDPSAPYHDIKGIVPIAEPPHNRWWWYLVGAALLVALFLLLFPLGKKEKPVAVLDGNAYKKALQQLDALQQSSTQTTAPKEYFTELIAIFRTYLKSGKGIQSFTKTTDDLGLQLKDKYMPAADYSRLLQTLRLSDLVKFANYNPTTADSTEALAAIRQSITLIEPHRYAV